MIQKEPMGGLLISDSGSGTNIPSVENHLLDGPSANDPGDRFSGTLLTGVFAGFSGTILCLVFNIFYRDNTGFLPSAVINVSSLIFGVNILFVFIGLLYFVFLRWLPKGDILFAAFFVLLTLVCLLGTAGVHRSDDVVVNHQFKGLLSGIIIILGVCCVAMPVLFHNKGFREHVI